MINPPPQKKIKPPKTLYLGRDFKNLEGLKKLGGAFIFEGTHLRFQPPPRGCPTFNGKPGQDPPSGCEGSASGWAAGPPAGRPEKPARRWGRPAGRPVHLGGRTRNRGQRPPMRCLERFGRLGDCAHIARPWGGRTVFALNATILFNGVRRVSAVWTKISLAKARYCGISHSRPKSSRGQHAIEPARKRRHRLFV